MNSSDSAVRRPSSARGQSPADSLPRWIGRIPSMTSCRHMRLRPAISIGSHASGISARANVGCVSPQTKACMQPIDVPMMSRSCVTPRPRQHPVLRLDHVVIIVFGETHPQPIRRLGRFPVTDIVGKDDPIFADVERLAGPVQFVGELRSQELLAVAAGAVQHHHGIVDYAGGIAVRLPEHRVMHPKRWQHFADHRSGSP